MGCDASRRWDWGAGAGGCIVNIHSIIRLANGSGIRFTNQSSYFLEFPDCFEWAYLQIGMIVNKSPERYTGSRRYERMNL